MQYELRHGRLSYRDALWASYWLVRYHLGHTGGEKPYEAAVKTLEGLEEEVLVERTQEWFDDEVGVIDGKVQDRRIEKTRNDVRHESRRTSFGDDGMHPRVGICHLAEHWGDRPSCDGPDDSKANVAADIVIV